MPLPALPADVLLWTPVCVLLFTTLVWARSLRIRDASIMDIAWGPGFLVAVLSAVVVVGNLTDRAVWIVLLTAIWGFRLAVHIWIRSRGREEDARYAAWRRQAGAAWWWRSWFKVFVLQGVILCVVALPLVVQAVSAGPAFGTVWDSVGLLLWGTGLAIETVADWQLFRFRRTRTSPDEVLDRGLWRYSRHPNYFGETVLWWGFGLMALSVPGGWITLAGPALITWLILRVSGVAMLERFQTRDKPAYADYVRRTSAFLPWKPRAPFRQESTDS